MLSNLRRFIFGLLSFVVVITLVSFFLDEPTASKIQESSYVSVFWLAVFTAATRAKEAFAKSFNHHNSEGE